MPSSSACSATDLVVVAPRPGTAVTASPGIRLRLRLRTGLGPSRWFIAACPGNLVPLELDGAEATFLVFDGAPSTLRLERRHPRSDVAREVCELRIEVSAAEELVRSA